MSLESQTAQPVYPSAATTRALADLAADPRTPPVAAPFLVALAATFPATMDETQLGPVRQAYDHALQLRQTPQSGPMGPASPVPSAVPLAKAFRECGGKSRSTPPQNSHLGEGPTVWPSSQ